MADLENARCYSAAADRNREPICTVLAQILPATGTVLEIASGSGQHAVFCAPRLTPRHWLPSDPDPAARTSIQGWLAADPCETLYPPLALNMLQPDWVQQVQTWTTATPQAPRIQAIANINMIHISPWAACQGLMAGAEALLQPGDVLYCYGPYQQNGQHTAPSNEAFDASLRSQNPAWGVRDLGDVVDLAATHQLQLSHTVEMPANNLSVIFVRR